MPETLEDPSNDGKLTLSSNPKESAEAQTSSNLGGSRGEDEPTLQGQSNINSKGHHSDKGEAGFGSVSDGKGISAKKDFIELNDYYMHSKLLWTTPAIWPNTTK